MGNVGTCRPDAKGALSARRHERQSTDAGHRDGTTRSRVEGAVMALDRRGGVVWFYRAGNPQGEDRRG